MSCVPSPGFALAAGIITPSEAALPSAARLEQALNYMLSAFLEAVADACLAPDVRARPPFAELVGRLLCGACASGDDAYEGYARNHAAGPSL